jgi:predicted DNA-binding transcriptional regulator YafY
MNLYNTIKGLIIEAVATSPIVDAIKNKHVCELSYEDDASIGPGKRIIDPVALGTSKRGNKVLRAYQTEGPSLKVNKEGIPLPDWRLFRLDRMNYFNPVKGDDSAFKSFTEPPLYNPVGDKSMTRMDINAKFV